MSAVPNCTRNIYFCYSPMLHKPARSMFPSDKDEDSTPATPWLQYSPSSRLGVEVVESKAPHHVRPPPLNDRNINRLNAWIVSTRKDRLLYWVCHAIIKGLASDLQTVGLLSSITLRIPAMLPVWLLLGKILHAQESGIDFSPDDLSETDEVCQRTLALEEMKRELHFGNIGSRISEKEIHDWAKAEFQRKHEQRQASFYRHEMAAWLLEDDDLCAAIATASNTKSNL